MTRTTVTDAADQTEIAGEGIRRRLTNGAIIDARLPRQTAVTVTVERPDNRQLAVNGGQLPAPSRR